MHEERPLVKRRQLNWRTVAVAMAVVWGVMVVGGIIYFIYNKQATKSQDNVELAKRITGKVSKIYLVPTDEKPTVAEVKDVSKLIDQPFYSQAQNGDYLILYPERKLAMIYRESSNKLIHVAPISIPNKGQ